MIISSRVARFKRGDRVKYHEEVVQHFSRLGIVEISEVIIDPIPAGQEKLLGHSARYALRGLSSVTPEDWMLTLAVPEPLVEELTLNQIVAGYKLGKR